MLYMSNIEPPRKTADNDQNPPDEHPLPLSYRLPDIRTARRSVLPVVALLPPIAGFAMSYAILQMGYHDGALACVDVMLASFAGGFLLGLASVAKIFFSDGRLRGRRLAVFATIFNCVGFALTVVAYLMVFRQ